MSTAAISYRSLKNAAGEARDVAKKLDSYASSLNWSVYKKLDNYDGSWNSNVRTASSNISSKISSLEKEADKYRDYADELEDVRDECKRVDKDVRKKVSKLTSDFKKANGIRDSKIANAVYYTCTKWSNSSFAGRWINDRVGDAAHEGRELDNEIKRWYNYEGGKQLIKGKVVALLEGIVAVIGMVAAVATFVAAIIAGTLTGFGVVVFVAAIVGGVIALVNAGTNWENETDAYTARQNGDPVTGYRRSELNTWSETKRTDSDKKSDHIIANIVDGIEIVCTVISIVDGGMKIWEKGSAWVKSGGLTSLKDVGKNLGSNAKATFSKATEIFKGKQWNKLGELGKMFSSDLGYIKQITLDYLGDFGKNMSNYFLNTDTVADGFKSLEHMFSVPKDLLSDGMFKTGFKLSLEGLTLFTASDGNATIADMTGLIDKTIKIFDSPVFDKHIKVDLMDKFDMDLDIDISVPEIEIGELNLSLSFGNGKAAYHAA